MTSAVTAAVATAQKDLASGVDALGLKLDQQQQGMLLSYLRLMEKWNRVYNLTAIRDLDRMVSHHLIDSLAIVPHIAADRVLDVGSGAGLPGIPLAVARPDLSVTMLDTNSKKTAFIQQAISELGIQNAQVVCARVEDWKAPHPFDAIISRAFSDLSDFVERAGHLLAARGEFVAMKGQRPDVEIERLPASFRLKKVVKLAVPGLDAERHLVFIEAAKPS